MIHHADLGSTREERQKNVRSLILQKKIVLGGYHSFKVYGTLSCSSGKRVKPEDRVFFESEQEAQYAGYRPCSYCLPDR